MTAKSIVMERTINASVDEIWPYISRGDLWARWQGKECSIDPKPGGELRIRMPNDAIVSGTILEAEPPNRLVFTWGWSDAPFTFEPGTSTVTITLKALSDKVTHLKLVHSGVPNELHGHHTGGWTHCLADLINALAE